MEPLQVSVLAVAHQGLVEEREPLALLGEGDTVARHGVPVIILGHVISMWQNAIPASHCQHVALVILPHQVLQHLENIL